MGIYTKLKKLIKKTAVEKNTGKLEEHIKTVCDATGWSRDKALAEMKMAKAIGMPYFRYAKNKCWDMTLDEIEKLNKKILDRKEAKEKEREELAKKKEQHIDKICEATGWSREKALNEMRKAKEETGMPYFRYANNMCWKLDMDQIDKLNKEIRCKEGHTAPPRIAEPSIYPKAIISAPRHAWSVFNEPARRSPQSRSRKAVPNASPGTRIIIEPMII